MFCFILGYILFIILNFVYRKAVNDYIVKGFTMFAKIKLNFRGGNLKILPWNP